MLTQMMNEANTLKEYSKPDQQIYMTLAHKFQSNPNFLFYDPEELVRNTGLGTLDQWKTLLNLQETNNYIKGQLAFYAQISQRKTFKSLVSEALSGNAQAAKQVQELSGAYNQQDSNRTIILHRIPRPSEVQE